MLNQFLDILPYDPTRNRHVVEQVKEEPKDTLDSISGYVQQMGDSVNHHNNLPLILGGVLAVLAALGLLLLMVRAYRRRSEQQVEMSGARL